MNKGNHLSNKKKSTLNDRIESAIITAVFLGIAIGAGFLSPPAALIMMMGIRVSKGIMLLLAVIAGSIAGFIGISLLKDIVRDNAVIEKQRQDIFTDKKITEDYQKDSGDAINTRRKLLQIKNTCPGYASLMEKCLSHMDRIDELQRRQKELITQNEAIYLTDTENTLDRVEREICLNFKGIVNQCIIAGETGDESKLDMDKVMDIIKRNRELLTQSKELLKVSADWIDEYNSRGKGDRSLLESWIKTIRDTIEKETM